MLDHVLIPTCCPQQFSLESAWVVNPCTRLPMQSGFWIARRDWMAWKRPHIILATEVGRTYGFGMVVSTCPGAGLPKGGNAGQRIT